MDRKLSTGVLSYVLTEQEWYSADDAKKAAWIKSIEKDGETESAKHLVILVQPDPIMSVCETPNRHRVWGSSTSKVDKLQEDLSSHLFARGKAMGLTPGAINVLAEDVLVFFRKRFELP